MNKTISILILIIILFSCSDSANQKASTIDQKKIIKELNEIKKDIDKLNKKPNTNYIAYLIVGMIGIITGAFINRQTEFKKYLLQKRIEIYSNFLEISEPCRRSALMSITNAWTNRNKFDINEIPQKLSEIFWPIIIKQFSVKLIINDEYKDYFEKMIQELQSLTINAHLETDIKKLKINDIENIFKKIEMLFEESIKKTKSNIFSQYLNTILNNQTQHK